jgi:mono/diheme cytochrome c family protein
MNIRNALLLACAALPILVASAQEREGPMHHGPGQADSGHGGMRGMGEGMHSMLRHQYVMREGLPAEYRALRNPLAADEATLEAGRRVYTQSCVVCHGDSGNGDGPSAAALDPRPSNIGQLPRMPLFSSDAYLYWTIAEGGAPIGTAMPVFKNALSAEDIWSVIHYVRDGL